jgi:hypothetical protein
MIDRVLVPARQRLHRLAESIPVRHKGFFINSGFETVFLNFSGAQESILPAYVAWRAGKSNRVFVPEHQTRNQFQGSLKRFKNSGSVLDF